ncbi:MAG: chemotaxis protein CheW [Deltaproteobacteria bacterium]|nr:chemotaxis protein CheW [Deltaproteobacteria bacterium]
MSEDSQAWDLALQENQFVIARVAGEAFGVAVREVKEMLVLPEVTEVPLAPPHVRGVIDLRGRVIPLLDLRLRLKKGSAVTERDELLALLSKMEQDHAHWLQELEACLLQDRQFALATDPTQCAFGRWYADFATANPHLRELLLQFDRPHRRIHAIAREALDLAVQGERQAALDLVEATRRLVLKRLMDLFAQARHVVVINHREIAMVLERGSRSAAVVVDEVESVEDLEEGSLAELDNSFGAGWDKLQRAIGRRRENREMVLVLDTAEVFRDLAGAEVAV